MRGRERTERAIGGSPLSLGEVLSLARGQLLPVLDPDPAHRDKLRRAREVLLKTLSAGRAVYGVTTGVGASSDVAIPPEQWQELPAHLPRFHGCGTGRILDETEAAAVVAVRLASLARGHSGVREAVLERLCDLLRLRVLPRIPEEGSVGASGDLTPLSYLASVLAGEREVSFEGSVAPAAEVLAHLDLEPLELAPKESLSLMNGTAVMTALACLAWERAAQLSRLATATTALAVEATRGNPGHYDARIFELKAHPGPARVAARLRALLESEARTAHPARLQDRYSLRCAPHVIGVLEDTLEHARTTLETELNGVDDNPLIDPDGGDVLHGGNFYGGHVCAAMDALKAAVAGVADLLDRQLVLLCVPETSAGLPANLVAAEAPTHHGFKAMQISASALTAEALKLTMPASAFSRSTESHNQDKVSMGTIAARDCRRVVELSETVAVISLLAGCQACDLREASGPAPPRPLARLRAAVRERVAPLREDRRQDTDIAQVLALHREGSLPLGDA